MNCHDALEFLESARPSSEDRFDPELAAASDHLENCSDCASLFASRESLDRRIGRVMRDVPVPAGLRDRIFEAAGVSISETVPKVVPAAKTVAPPQTRSRRRFLHALVGVSIAAAAVVTGVMFLMPGDPPPDTRLTLDDLRDNTTLQFAKLSPFNGDFKPKPPGGLWQHRIEFKPTVKGDLPDKQGKHRVAMYGFTIHNADGTKHEGIVLAIPTDQLVDPPSETTINTRRNDVYARRSDGNWHMFSWRSKDETVTYVCYLKTSDNALESLQQALTPPAA